MWPDIVTQTTQLAVALTVVLLAAWLGGMVFRWLRQPPVVGEIVAGLAVGLAVAGGGGSATVERVLPEHVLTGLGRLGEVGLVLFLLGVAHEIKPGASGAGARALGWVTAGSLLPALLTGCLLAGWVIHARSPGLRGTAPTAAFVLLLAVVLGVTAVPVLARILTDRGMMATPEGQLSMGAAIAIDAVAWLLLALASALAAGGYSGTAVALGALTVGGCAAVGLRLLLRTSTAAELGNRHPIATVVGLGVVALAAAHASESYGLTAIFGAVLVGLAVPPGGSATPWHLAVLRAARPGRALAPAFFVVTGAALLAEPDDAAPWAAVVVATCLAIAGKTGGGYLGARLGGQARPAALRIGTLMNTRGLTEIVVLQAGYDTGILTPALYVALLVMGLITTALTGPLLGLIDRIHPPRPRLPTAPDVRWRSETP